MEKNKKKELHEIFENTCVKKVEVEDELKKSFISYAMAVNVSRAIPDVRDGLKPVHRRILYGMSDLNNFYNKPHKKCARIVGEVMGKYHPHGDGSIYDALVRLAQEFSIRYPLVDGHGNFGSVDGDPPAAQRYTEARLAKISNEMLTDLDKETVDFYPNFDDTLMQPRVLPARFPNLLVNGADGIAVGMATNIPPHNLIEVINAAQALLDNPEIEIEDIIKIIPGPDYPTGGIVMGRAALLQAYRTGRGGVVIRGKTDIEEENGRSRIVITELPYQVNKSKFIIQMADMVKSKRLEGISDIKEESDREGMRIVVDVKRDANAQVVLNSLFKHTQLQQSGGIIFLALVDGVPRILNIKEILYYYVEHQKEIITRRTKFNLRKADERCHIVDGLVIAMTNIDAVIKLIKESSDRNSAFVSLQKIFELSEIQANAILDMSLSKLTGIEVVKLKEELATLKSMISDYNDILNSSKRVVDIIKAQLEDIKVRYGDKRRTEISLDYGDIDISDLIAREDVVISKTHGGYIKRMNLTEYKSQKRGGMGVAGHKTKEEDFVDGIFITCTHSDLLFFTSEGRVYVLKAYEIPEAQKQAKGRAMLNLLQLRDGECVTAIIPIAENESRKNIIMATKNGLIKKTNISEFISIRKVGKIAITLVDGDTLVAVGLTDDIHDVLIAGSSGKCIRFNAMQIREVGRSARGVKSMNLKKNEHIVDMEVIDDTCQILTISENGYGKRCNPSEYRLQGRGGMGVKAGIFNEKTGDLVNLKQVKEDQDIIIVSDNGVVIRTPAENISLLSRNTQGVKLMTLKGDAKVVCVAPAEKESEEELIAENNQLSEVLSKENIMESHEEQFFDKNETEQNIKDDEDET
ncbi:MAG: DNA gyrase subunit A [Clostridia bacterium]